MEPKIIKTKLGEIEYNSVGKGIPVLLIHGVLLKMLFR